ncbi:MAG: hypothetical protein JNG86_07980, partial [Verrucomicrobiaceae bacterium]|nr:hypothetical protein [Verrucomicrobiaceae bacterium]
MQFSTRFFSLLLLSITASAADWSVWAPRKEAEPVSASFKDGGHEGKDRLILETEAGEHWIGCWTSTVPVEGGKHYQFSTWRKHSPMSNARRCVYARVIWQDAQGKAVTWEEPAKQGYAKGTVPRAEPEYPRDPGGEANKWARYESVLRTPLAAKQARIELYLQWVPKARVEWSDVQLTQVPAPASRKVKLATIHLLPKEGKNPADKPPQYAPLIAEAAKQKADLVVLGETLTYYRTGK